METAGQGAHDFSAEVYRYCSSEITVERRDAVRWAVCRHGAVYNKDGQWEYEPLPSSRGEDFKSRTRYSLHEAFEVARRAFVADVTKST